MARLKALLLAAALLGLLLTAAYKSILFFQ